MKERVFPSNVQPIATEIKQETHLEKHNSIVGKKFDWQKFGGGFDHNMSSKHDAAEVLEKGMFTTGFEKRMGKSHLEPSKQKLELMHSTGFNYSKAKQFEETNRVITERNNAVNEKLIRIQALSEQYDTEVEKSMTELREARERLAKETIKCDELQKAKETLKIEVSEARAKLERVEKSLDKKTIIVHKNNSKLAETGSELINAKTKFEITKQALEAAKIKRNIDGHVTANTVQNQLQDETAVHAKLAAELTVVSNEFNKKLASVSSLRSNYKEYQRLLTEFNLLRLKYYEELNQRTMGRFIGIDARMS